MSYAGIPVSTREAGPRSLLVLAPPVSAGEPGQEAASCWWRLGTQPKCLLLRLPAKKLLSAGDFVKAAGGLGQSEFSVKNFNPCQDGRGRSTREALHRL